MDFIGLLAEHGYAILFAITFVDQFGAPLPAIAVLLAAGALAGEGRLSFAVALAAAWAGT